MKLTIQSRWLAVLFAAAVVRLWLMPLPSSFWVDETVTAFVIDHPNDPSLHVAPQVPASIYYALPRIATALGGSSEIVYRIPSILAMLAAVWLIARLSARLIHPASAWFAAFACLALHGIDYFAVDARPYGFGILAGAAAVWLLVRWLDTARWLDALLFAACAALLWRIHLIYWPFYPVMALYAGARVVARKTAVGWHYAALIFLLIGFLLLPVANQAIGIEHNAGAHVIVPQPTWRDFIHLLRWNLVLIAAIGAWLLRKFDDIGVHDRPGDLRLSTVLILAWWLVPPMLLFALSRATGQSVYITRYLSIALPGIALTATLAAARLLPAHRWSLAAALMGLGALVILGQWSILWPRHEKSGWREAVAAVNRVEAAAPVPVVCTSPFIEARPPDWQPDYKLPGFLYSHLAYYPIRGPIVLFPFQDSPEANAYAAELLRSQLTASGAFLIYGGAGNARFWQHWFAARPELRGWSNHRYEWGDVYVIRFWRPQ